MPNLISLTLNTTSLSGPPTIGDRSIHILGTSPIIVVPPTPTVTISNAIAQLEGNNGDTTLFTYSVDRSTAIGDVSVNWYLTAGDTNSGDYTSSAFPMSGTMVFPAGTTRQTFSVSVRGDNTVEMDETFTVFIVVPTGYAAGRALSATGLIINDDTNTAPAPILGALSLSMDAFQSGTASSGVIFGSTSGSLITAQNLPNGFTINSAARTWAYDGSPLVGEYTITLIETLGSATGSPKSNDITLVFATVSNSGFGLTSNKFYRLRPSYVFITGTQPNDVVSCASLPAGITVDAANLRVSWDGTGQVGTEYLTLTRTPPSGPSETVVITLSIAAITVQPAPADFMGINVGGLEQYVVGASAAPQVAQQKTYDAAAGRGLKFIRQTARWERLQPSGLNTTIDAGYVQTLKDACGRAYKAGQKWILDIHNYMRYNNSGTVGIIGTTVQISDYVNMISQLATAMKGTPGYYGLDFMNEPSLMPSLDTAAQLMQAAINAVRDPNGANDQNVVCYIECNNYSSAWSFDGINPGLETLTDPANRFLIMVHMYPDIDDSGSGLDYADKINRNPYLPYHLQVLGGASGPSAPKGLPVGPNIGVQRMQNALNKILSYNFPVVDGFTFCLGEAGIPCDTQYIGKYGYSAPYGDGTDADDAAWRVVFENTATWCKQNGVQVLLWQAGPQLGYAYTGIDFQCLEPDDSGLQRIQMASVTKYTGAPEPTVFRFDAPQYADVGAASQPCRITYRGNVTSPSVFTPSDNGAGGTFSPATLTMPVGTNFVGTFTYTPASARRVVLSVASSTGLTAITSPSMVGSIQPQTPGTLMLSSIPASNDVVRAVTESGRPIQALISRTHLLNKSWSGPIVQLCRVSDGALRDFYATSLFDDRLNRQEIADWAGTTSSTNSNLIVNLVYDQSGHGGNEYANGNGYRATYTLDGGDGYPVESKGSGTKSSFNCNINGNALTMIFDASYTSGSYVLMFTANIGGSVGITNQFAMHTGATPDANNNRAGSYFSIPNELQNNGFHTYSYRFNPNTVNGMQSYRDGVLIDQVTTDGGIVTWPRATCEVGWFRFYDATAYRMVAKVRNILVSDYAYTDAEIAALSAICTNPYATAWPSFSGTTYPPVIAVQTNPNWTVATGKPVSPFFSCTDTATSPFRHTIALPPLKVTNPDVSMTVTASLRMSAANGSLSVPGATQDPSDPLHWTYPAMTPAALTGALVGTTNPQNVGGAYNLYPGVVFTPSASGQTTTFSLTVTNSGGASTSYNATTVTSVDVAAIETPFAAPTGAWNPIGNLKGANMSAGMSHSGDATMDSRNYSAGTYNYAYGYGASYEYAYLASKGFGVARLGFSLRRLLPRPFAILDTNETARFKSLIDDAYSRGQTIILDMHDYGAVYDAYAAGGTYQQLANASPYAQSILIDAWKRIASLFKNYPNVIFDINNEPNPGAADWSGIVRNVIAGIRSIGANQLILIEGGTHSSDSNSWASTQGTIWDDFNQPGWTGVNGDPADNFAFSPHRYLDAGSGNTSVVVAGSGNTVLASATNWATTKNDGTARAKPFKMFLGEFGWSQNDNQPSGGVPSVEGYNLVNYMNTHPVWIGGAYFVMGPKNFFAASVSTSNNSTEATAAIPTYSNNVATADPPQMAVLQRWLLNT